MKKYFLCMVALLSLAIVACESDDTAPAPTVRPTFDLIDAQPDVTSAVVAANIESKGEVPISEVGFSYQEAGGEYVDVVCTNFKDGLARQTLTGLKPDTEYRWYCYAVLGGERFNASLSKTFKTLKEGEVPPAPTPQFGKPSASEVQATSASLACAYLYTGDAADIAEAGFGYKPAASAQTGYTMVEITPDDSSLSARLEELTPETAYEFYAYLVIDGKNYTSERVVFTTLKEGEQPGAPQFETPSSSGVSPTGATLACVYEYEGDGDVAEAGFGYKAGAQEEYTEVKAASTASPLACELNGLEPETKYDFYAYVVVGDERYTSAVAQFTTLKAGENPEPEFGPVAATDVTASSATLTGNFTYEGEETVGIEVGFAYKPSGETDYTTKTVTASSGDKRAAITGLSAATTYTFHLYASIGGKQYRSEEGTFTTESGTVPPPENVYRTGWAELPVEVQNSDYYYAHHICPDFYVGSQKARNYTVCFSAEHHCPVWVAAPRHACYEVKGTDRTDAYSRDPDIPSGIQYSSKSTGGGCNKGHMLGSAERLVTRKTNEQVFYYSNIAPQYSSNFNNGGGAWNNLESFVDAQVCADTTYIVVGTYFEPFTDAYGKSCTSSKIDFGGRSDVSRPSMFYYLLLRTKNGNTKKSVMDCAASELKCAAFVLRHNMDKGHEPQAKDMMSVAEIERLTGFTFFANVPNAPKDTYNPSDWGL